MLETGKIFNGNCVDEMSKMPENSIDLVVTSPPYNVGIDYDSHDDRMSMDSYWQFTKDWLTQVLRVLKSDGRIAINIPYEVNVQERGGRILFMAEFWGIMREVGFKFYGLVDLDENSPHRSKTTAWGSWMSPSSPYIYNPKECVILAYKKDRIKKVKGEPQWIGKVVDMVGEDGEIKKKTIYEDEDKKEFMSLVYGQWEYFADTRQQTKATFSMDIPMKAIKILTYRNDIILDPFAGSGTSLCAAEIANRQWVGIELSEKYCEVARKRVDTFINDKKQTKIEFE
jgi:site-specific DNA-methyltransferase (adenine-specific)